MGTSVKVATPLVQRTSVAKIIPPAVNNTRRVDFRSLILAQLSQAKRYPPRARRRQQEGSVRVSFAVEIDGRVTDARLEHTSGFSLLDKAALRLLEYCSPLPKPPERMTFSFSIRYELQDN